MEITSHSVADKKLLLSLALPKQIIAPLMPSWLLLSYSDCTTTEEYWSSFKGIMDTDLLNSVKPPKTTSCKTTKVATSLEQNF